MNIQNFNEGLDTLQADAEIIKKTVMRAIEDGEQFEDAKYRELQDKILRARLDIEFADNYFFAAYKRKNRKSKLMVVNEEVAYGILGGKTK